MIKQFLNELAYGLLFAALVTGPIFYYILFMMKA